MTWNLTNGLVELFTELGITIGGGKDMVSDLAGATVNDCSPVEGDQSLPISLIAWDGYNHSAGPPVCTGIAGNPGNDASPTADPTQNDSVYLAWTLPTCAASADVLRADTSGGTYSVVDSDNADDFFTQSLGASETSKFYKLRGNSNTGREGTLSAYVELRTCPVSPKGPGNSDDSDCSHWTITVTWTNGTSPGTRDSVVKWRVRFKPDGGSYGSWSSETATASQATSFVYEGGSGISNDDEWEFDMYYAEESTGTRVTTTNVALCAE